MTQEEALAWFQRRKEMGLSDRTQEAENWAIRALEVMIPRILTSEELRGLVREETDIWIENRDGIILVDTFIRFTQCGENEYLETHFLSPCLNKYEETWRCWTARPTDEQRKEAKWDE